MALKRARTKFGVVTGVPGTHSNFTIYKGVPYAKPPVGILRFQNPQEMEPWDGELACDVWPEMCVQKARRDGKWIGSEDCLYLNIWTPAETEDAELPVMFWIHGGGWQSGDNHGALLDGEAYNEHGVILVTIGYRLGLLGFLGLEDWREQDPNGTTGNYGMADIIAGLEWVKNNIRAFGGNPENITIAGQSSGAMAVKWLLGCKLAKGLFQHAIAQSGGGTWDIDPILPLEEKCEYGRKLLDFLGMKTEDLYLKNGIELCEKADAVMSRLNLPQKSLVATLFQPAIDGYLVTDYYGKKIFRGEVCDVDVMCGTIREEWRNFIYQVPGGIEGYNHEFALSPCIAWGERNIEQGRKPIYHYYFDHDLPGDSSSPRHGSEMQYTFGLLDRVDRPWEDYDREISAAAVDYWCAFAKSGNPNIAGRPEWPAYTEKHRVTMHFANDGIHADELYSNEKVQRVVKFLLNEPGILNSSFLSNV